MRNESIIEDGIAIVSYFYLFLKILATPNHNQCMFSFLFSLKDRLQLVPKPRQSTMRQKNVCFIFNMLCLFMAIKCLQRERMEEEKKGNKSE